MRFSCAIMAAALTMLAASAHAQSARDILLKRGYDFEEILYVDCIDGFALHLPQGDACEKLLSSDELSDPRTGAAYAQRSAIYSALGQYQRALEEADTAISLDSKNAVAHAMRGAANWNLDHDREATADFERALEYDPDNADANFGRGAAYFRTGQFSAALRHFGLAIALRPEYVAAYVYRGETNAWLNRHEDAIADFETAIRLDPDDWRALLSRGNLFASLGRYREALADYDAAIGAAPDIGAAHNSKAWLLATATDPALRDGTTAGREAQMALGLDASDPEFYDTLAAAYAEAGDFESAIESQNEAIGLWRAQHDDESIRGGEERLALYRAGSPYRDLR